MPNFMRDNFFPDIQYEVEHNLFLARIRQVDTGRRIVNQKLPKSDEDRAALLMAQANGLKPPLSEKKVMAVEVYWIPKYQAVLLGPNDQSAYRVLYEWHQPVGEFTTPEERDKLTVIAQRVAERISDPVMHGKEERM